MNSAIFNAVAKTMAKSCPIFIDYESVENMDIASIIISPNASHVEFRIQNGSIKEVGNNGCQVDDIIVFAHELIKEFDKVAPCIENKYAALHLKDALAQLAERRLNRVGRGVEGTSEA